MLNNITRVKRLQLRRLRSLYLLALVGSALLAAVLLIGGAWLHVLPGMLLSPLLVPLTLRARVCYRGVARSLRLLGA